MREATVNRKTKETDIEVTVRIDGAGEDAIATGIGFLDHMLTAFAVHGGFDVSVSCAGDLDVDGHHTVEDVGIVLGQAFARALGDKSGIARYGSFTLPMDESLAICAVDLSGRPYFVYNVSFLTERIGGLDTQLVGEFFRAFAMNAGLTLHLNAPYGENDHHKCEALFKATAHALKAAVRPSGEAALSTKGVL
ncbi:MAG: imidazoleglycerol-phosphate dehydratase HisB [Clostridiales Family XIII bacterium]|jgi:imidazoleglycerol-phosphate dehydratase|nr:imidazoleglycerol-phosphate dehydratase HisB [Clostridiales Family XIII bacterium]